MEFGETIPADKKQPIEDALAELKKAHEAQDVPTIETAMEKLNTVFQAASQEMYSQQPQGDAGSAGQDESKGDEEVTDVDFEEVKEEK